jgi:hypothetical protein
MLIENERKLHLAFFLFPMLHIVFVVRGGSLQGL